MLVVLSPAAVASHNVMDEVSYALETRKTLIPVLHRECTIPFRLRRVQYVDFRSDYDTAVRRLLKTLGVEDRTVVPELVKPAGAASGSTSSEQPSDALKSNAER